MTTLPAPYERLQRALESKRVRIAFLGQATYFDYCALEAPHPPLEPRFFDYRFGEPARPVLEAIRAFDPHLVLMFRPELLPEGALRDNDAVTVGFLTEPVPRAGGEGHPDLERRLRDLEMLDAGNWDRIISFDPLVAQTADAIAPVWRSMPLPVSDAYFADADTRSRDDPKVLFTGRSTEHRESFLGPAKHLYDVIHAVHGITGERLRELLQEVDVGLNLHNEPYPTFENRVCVYCAAGLLLVSEPLSPTHGLEPRIDFVQVGTPPELMHALFTLRRDPTAFERHRIRGRQKAERFRASSVYGRLVEDLARDLAAFGSPRGC